MRINPFTIKELRQLTRAKTISGTLVTFLFACLAICYIVPVNTGINSDTGKICFCFLMGLLTLVLGIVLPANAYTRLTRERGGTKGSPPDLTLLTALSPAEVIDGKIRAAIALMVLFTTAAMPFGVVAYLMHGISFAVIAQALAVIFCMSLAAVHIMLAIASLRILSALRLIIFCIMFFALSCTSTPLIFGVICDEINPGALEPFLLFVAAMVTLSLIFRGAAIAFLSPLVMERDKPLRQAILVSTLGWLAYVLSRVATAPDSFADTVMTYDAITSIVAVILAGYASAQPLARSRRMITARAAMGRFKRFITWPFASGCTNAFAFAFLIAAIAAAAPVNHILANRDGSSITLFNDWRTCCTAITYSFALLLFARFLWVLFAARSKGLSPRITPTVVPLAAFAVGSMAQSIPSLLEILQYPLQDPDTFPLYFAGIQNEPKLHILYASCAFGISAFLTCLTSFIKTRK